MKKMTMKVLGMFFLFILSATVVFAQDACEGNFDCDQDVDGSDAALFKSDFGRSGFNFSCPSCLGPAPVPKTGQKGSHFLFPGEDGVLRKGVSWPNPRFTDNNDGTITDNLTGLIWLKNANCINTHYPGFDSDSDAGDGRVTWQHALDFTAGINDGTYSNCGGSPPHDDWRLPNKKELISLTHDDYDAPPLSNTAGTGQWSEGDPFTNVQFPPYWSSTTFAPDITRAWLVDMDFGVADYYYKNYFYYVWPVRGGQ